VPRADARSRTRPDLPAVARHVAVLVLLGVAVLASALAGPWSPQYGEGGGVTVDVPVDPPTPEGPATPTAQADPEGAAEQLGGTAPAWLLPVLMTAALLAVALLVLHVARRLRRSDRAAPADLAPTPAGPGFAGTPDRSPDLRALRDGVAAAAEHLRSAARPADAVVAAWVRLEEAAAASGLPRDPATTPSEFALAVLDRTDADGAATRVLLQLYLRARFGEERLGADDVAAARRAVEGIAAALAGAASGTSTTAGAGPAGSPHRSTVGEEP
jgi:hypothetical protein